MTSSISRSAPAAAHAHGYAKSTKSESPSEGFEALFASMAGGVATAPVAARDEKSSDEGAAREETGKSLITDAAIAAKIDAAPIEMNPNTYVAANEAHAASGEHAAPERVATEPALPEKTPTVEPRLPSRTTLSARGAVQEALVALIRSPGRPRQSPADETNAITPETPAAKSGDVPHAPNATAAPASAGVVVPGVEVIDVSPTAAKPSASSRAAADIARQRQYALSASMQTSATELSTEPTDGAPFEAMIAARTVEGATGETAVGHADVDVAMPAPSGTWVANLPATPQSIVGMNPVTTPRTFDQAAWSAALAEQVAAAAVAATRETSVRVEPEGLGPIEVRVRIEAERVDVRFAIEHPVTVNMVRAALPDLERLLAQSGMSLGQANVAQQNAGGREQGARGTSSVSHVESKDVESAPVAHAPLRSRVGLLDDFV